MTVDELVARLQRIAPGHYEVVINDADTGWYLKLATAVKSAPPARYVVLGGTYSGALKDPDRGI